MVDFVGGGLVGMDPLAGALPINYNYAGQYANTLAGVAPSYNYATAPSTLYGGTGFGDLTNYYSALGAQYNLGIGGGFTGDLWGAPTASAPAPSYDYGSLYGDKGGAGSTSTWDPWGGMAMPSYQAPQLPSYDYGSLYQAPQLPSYDYGSLYQQPQMPSYDYGSLYKGGGATTWDPWGGMAMPSIDPNSFDYLGQGGAGGVDYSWMFKNPTPDYSGLYSGVQSDLSKLDPSIFGQGTQGFNTYGLPTSAWDPWGGMAMPSLSGIDPNSFYGMQPTSPLDLGYGKAFGGYGYDPYFGSVGGGGAIDYTNPLYNPYNKSADMYGGAVWDMWSGAAMPAAQQPVDYSWMFKNPTPDYPGLYSGVQSDLNFENMINKSAFGPTGFGGGIWDPTGGAVPPWMTGGALDQRFGNLPAATFSGDNTDLIRQFEELLKGQTFNPPPYDPLTMGAPNTLTPQDKSIPYLDLWSGAAMPYTAPTDYGYGPAYNAIMQAIGPQTTMPPMPAGFPLPTSAWDPWGGMAMPSYDYGSLYGTGAAAADPSAYYYGSLYNKGADTSMYNYTSPANNYNTFQQGSFLPPWQASIPSPMNSPATIDAMKQYGGWDPAALTAMIQMESNWNPATTTGSYTGLTQMGPKTFADAGGTLGGMTWDQYVTASPAAQISAYADWLNYYSKNPNTAASLVTGGIGSLDPAMQYAIMQGTQFGGFAGLPGTIQWPQALAAGNMDMPVVPQDPRYAQAESLGAGLSDPRYPTIASMYGAGENMMAGWPQQQLYTNYYGPVPYWDPTGGTAPPDLKGGSY